MSSIKLLAIDTSCDDTSAAVVLNGRTIAANVVSSQNMIHEKFGGIVPELASRTHVEMIWPVVRKALSRAGTELKDIDAVAVCHGPGLIGSLIVGCSFAKSLSYALCKPLIGVNHLEGHVFSAFLMDREPPGYPFLCLTVSGGHTALYRVDGYGAYRELGRTRDDAAGEAYDKVAKMLGLGYPGGPAIDRLAAAGNPNSVKLPRAWLPETHDFSFSGLKTSVRNVLAKRETSYRVEDVCASFQAAVMDVLIGKVQGAVKAERISRVVLCGGVAANGELRRRAVLLGEQEGVDFFIPPPSLCTDNAAMIAAAGYFAFQTGRFSPITLNPKAYLPLGGRD